MKKKKVKVKGSRRACSAKWTANKFVSSVWGVMKKQEKKSPSIKLLHKKLEGDIINREKK